MAPAVDRLEPRRLLAAELSIVSVSAAPANVTGGDIISFDVKVDNHTSEPLQLDAKVIYSPDAVFGDRDDRVTAGVFRPDSVIRGKRGGVATVDAEVPGTLVGQYQIGIVLWGWFPFSSYTLSQRTDDVKWLSPIVSTIHAPPEWPQRSVFASHQDDVVIYSYSGEAGGEFLSVNGDKRRLPAGDTLYVDLGWGNDKFVAVPTISPTDYVNVFGAPLIVKGFAGKDTILGGNANDNLIGGNGKDKLFGGLGSDTLSGGAGPDRLYGYYGDDLLFGHGGHDRLVDFDGRDTLLGGAGDDLFITRNPDPTQTPSAALISGHAGYDRAQIDSEDRRAGIEEILA